MGNALMSYIPSIPSSANTIQKNSVSYTGLGNQTTAFYIHKSGGSNAETRDDDIHIFTEMPLTSLACKIDVNPVSFTLNADDSSNYNYANCYVYIDNSGVIINSIVNSPALTNDGVITTSFASFLLMPSDASKVRLMLHIDPSRLSGASSSSRTWAYQANISYTITWVHISI